MLMYIISEDESVNVDLGQGAHIFDSQDITAINEAALDSKSRLLIHPKSFYDQFNQTAISQFCLENGLYSLPTLELINEIRLLIGESNAIEIGSGNGALGRALGIKMTDSYQQELPVYKAHYKSIGHATITYSSDVIKCDALTAVKRFKPHTVVGAWVTHKFNPKDPERHGNEVGIDMIKLLKRVRRIILIGNESVHKGNPLMDIDHQEISHPSLVSRSFKNDLNKIYIWER